MKAALVFLCLPAFVFAQEKTRFGQDADVPRLAAACGPAKTGFKVELDSTQRGPLPPQAGKAMIYFIHDAGLPYENITVGYPTTKYALDGSWVGAGHGDSWFAVPVTPGVHHLCAALQSSIVDQRVELAHLTVEAGKTYFFRTRLVLSGTVQLLEFGPIDSDEGEYVVSGYPMATAHVKK
jgi:hypothetical protein